MFTVQIIFCEIKKRVKKFLAKIFTAVKQSSDNDNTRELVALKRDKRNGKFYI